MIFGLTPSVVPHRYDENVERLAFQATEVYDMWQAMAPLEAAAARERQLQGTRLEPSGNFPGGAGRVRDKIGASAGLSGRNVKGITGAAKPVQLGGKFPPT